MLKFRGSLSLLIVLLILLLFFFLFLDASWLPDNHVVGAGFMLTWTNKQIIIAGCIRIKAHSIIEAELGAMEIGLRITID